MIVGKAIFEGILLKSHFARFFLNKFSGSRSNQMDELQSLDPDLYSNLMKLKYYDEGNVEDLGLSFCVTEDYLGTAVQIPLVRNGEEEVVTNENKLEYIMYYADYVLNKKTKKQTEAFVEGLHTVINKDKFSIFFSDEIQLLITGGIEEEINIDDLRKHTIYHGFRDTDPYIKEFWRIIKDELTPE
jgi:HECT-domain (ubiquitin-transferase)